MTGLNKLCREMDAMQMQLITHGSGSSRREVSRPRKSAAKFSLVNLEVVET